MQVSADGFNEDRFEDRFTVGSTAGLKLDRGPHDYQS